MGALTPGVYKKISAPDENLYVVSIPENVEQGDPLPMILALHWGGMVTPFYGQGILLGLVLPALGDLGAIVIAPDCISGDWTSQECWQIVSGLLDEISDEYPVDEEKILVTGYSKGGMGAWYTASQNMERFSCAVPVSAPVPSYALGKPWRIPLYVIHSRNDELFSWRETAAACDGLRRDGAELMLNIIDGPTHFQTDGFIPALREAAGWVKDIWERE